MQGERLGTRVCRHISRHTCTSVAGHTDSCMQAHAQRNMQAPYTRIHTCPQKRTYQPAGPGWELQTAGETLLAPLLTLLPCLPPVIVCRCNVEGQCKRKVGRMKGMPTKLSAVGILVGTMLAIGNGGLGSCMEEGDGWSEPLPPDKQCLCPHGALHAGEIPPTPLIIMLLPPVITSPLSSWITAFTATLLHSDYVSGPLPSIALSH